MRIFLGIILICTAFAGAALACDYCLLTQGISPLETAKGIGFRVDERYTRLSTQFEHGQKIENGNQLETHWTTQLTAFYNLKSRFTLVTFVPYVRRYERDVPEEGEGGHGISQKRAPVYELHHGGKGAAGTAHGFGDITLLGRYQAIKKHTLTSTFVAAVQAGMRFPTGSTNAKDDHENFLDSHLQPGTGAFNYLFGLSTSYAFKRFNLVANGLFNVTGEGEVGPDKYEYGNALNYDAAVRFRINSGELAPFNFFAALGVAGEYRRDEIENGVPLVGSGGHTLYLAPGLQIFYRSLVFEAAFWHAIYHDIDGEQLGETFKTFAGIGYLIQ
jgi:hypothetical protein